MNISHITKAAAPPDWNYPEPSEEGIGLYIHFPFCKSKCHYCDFNTYAGIETLKRPYTTALLSEMRSWGNLLNSPPVVSVFLGGGTPSYMSSGTIADVLDIARKNFHLKSDAEITLEANPDDCDDTTLRDWRVAGVNRLSMGVQSFDEALLQMLERRHSVNKAIAAFKTAKKYFDNVSIDLMYGLPLQSERQWSSTLDTALSLDPDHLSLYCLQIEPSTPMKRSVDSGALPVPSDDLAADMYDYAMEILAKAGFVHYEISNWSKPNMRAMHNLLYWKNAPYLGVGAGAHSSLFGRRFSNCKPPKEYIKRNSAVPPAHSKNKENDPIGFMQKTGPVAMVETIDRKTAIFETMMLGMRLAEGVSNDTFYSLFKVGIDEVHGKVLADAAESGLVEFSGNSVRLSPKGRRLSNELFSRLAME